MRYGTELLLRLQTQPCVMGSWKMTRSNSRYPARALRMALLPLLPRDFRSLWGTSSTASSGLCSGLISQRPVHLSTLPRIKSQVWGTDWGVLVTGAPELTWSGGWEEGQRGVLAPEGGGICLPPRLTRWGISHTHRKARIWMTIDNKSQTSAKEKSFPSGLSWFYGEQ